MSERSPRTPKCCLPPPAIWRGLIHPCMHNNQPDGWWMLLFPWPTRLNMHGYSVITRGSKYSWFVNTPYKLPVQKHKIRYCWCATTVDDHDISPKSAHFPVRSHDFRLPRKEPKTLLRRIPTVQRTASDSRHATPCLLLLPKLLPKNRRSQASTQKKTNTPKGSIKYWSTFPSINT